VKLFKTIAAWILGILLLYLGIGIIWLVATTKYSDFIVFPTLIALFIIFLGVFIIINKFNRVSMAFAGVLGLGYGFAMGGSIFWVLGIPVYFDDPRATGFKQLLSRVGRVVESILLPSHLPGLPKDLVLSFGLVLGYLIAIYYWKRTHKIPWLMLVPSFFLIPYWLFYLGLSSEPLLLKHVFPAVVSAAIAIYYILKGKRSVTTAAAS